MNISYKRAIEWIALNDDVTDIDFAPTPTSALIADLFGKEDETVVKDIKNYIEKRK